MGCPSLEVQKEKSLNRPLNSPERRGRNSPDWWKKKQGVSRLMGGVCRRGSGSKKRNKEAGTTPKKRHPGLNLRGKRKPTIEKKKKGAQKKNQTMPK